MKTLPAYHSPVFVCRLPCSLGATLSSCSLMLLFSGLAQAGNATWDLNPGSGDWNTATNWTPMTVPNGPADVATFALSNATNVSISADTAINGITFTPAATNSYTITANGLTLTLSGSGITNNSGTMQNFITNELTTGGFFEHLGHIFFTNNATAGNLTNFTNNGGTTFNALGGDTQFFNNSSAGNANFTNNAITVSDAAEGGSVLFHDNSTAANGTFTNKGGIGDPHSFNGGVFFFDNSTAANGIFVNDGGSGARGGTVFFGGTVGSATFINNGAPTSGGTPGFTALQSNSGEVNGTFTNNGGLVAGASGGETVIFTTAGKGTFTNNSGMVAGAFGGKTQIVGLGTAANGSFTNNGGTVSGAYGGVIEFSDSATADDAIITNNGGTVSGAKGGSTVFMSAGTTADSATLIGNGGLNGGEGGTIVFKGASTGGKSRIEVFNNGNLDISFHDATGPHVTMEVGSIEGSGNVFLGANNLTVGTNNLSTSFSGTIQDGGLNGGEGGSLTKIGSGTLILSGNNSYTGDTIVNGGVLQVDGSITDATNTTVRGGVLQVNGSITSNNFIKPHGTLLGTGSIHGDTTNDGVVSPGDSVGTMTISGNYIQQVPHTIRGTLLIDIMGTASGQYDVLNVLGVAHLGGILDPMLLNGFVPSIGEQFTFIEYSSFSGAFTFRNGGIFDNGTERWAVTYTPTEAILTVRNVSDRGPTLLLLTLSFLGLVTCQRQLRH